MTVRPTTGKSRAQPQPTAWVVPRSGGARGFSDSPGAHRCQVRRDRTAAPHAKSQRPRRPPSRPRLPPPLGPTPTARRHTQVARFDFSWGGEEYHQETLDNLKQAIANTGKMCATMLDTRGPEICINKGLDATIQARAARPPCPGPDLRRSWALMLHPCPLHSVQPWMPVSPAPDNRSSPPLAPPAGGRRDGRAHHGPLQARHQLRPPRQLRVPPAGAPPWRCLCPRHNLEQRLPVVLLLLPSAPRLRPPPSPQPTPDFPPPSRLRSSARATSCSSGSTSSPARRPRPSIWTSLSARTPPSCAACATARRSRASCSPSTSRTSRRRSPWCRSTTSRQSAAGAPATASTSSRSATRAPPPTCSPAAGRSTRRASQTRRSWRKWRPALAC